MNSTFKTVVLWVVLIGVVTVLWQLIKNVGNASKDVEISYTQFQTQLAQGNIKKVTIVGNEAHGEYVHDSSKTFHLVVPGTNPDLLKDLKANNVEVVFKDNQGLNWPMWIFQFSPFLLRNLMGRGASSVKLAVLLDKQSARCIALQPDYFGFLLNEAFVVGYGLGAPDVGRNLPFIAARK